MAAKININCTYQVLGLPGLTTQVSAESSFMTYVIICSKHTNSFSQEPFQTLIDADSSKSLNCASLWISCLSGWQYNLSDST